MGSRSPRWLQLALAFSAQDQPQGLAAALRCRALQMLRMVVLPQDDSDYLQQLDSFAAQLCGFSAAPAAVAAGNSGRDPRQEELTAAAFQALEAVDAMAARISMPFPSQPQAAAAVAHFFAREIRPGAAEDPAAGAAGPTAAGEGGAATTAAAAPAAAGASPAEEEEAAADLVAAGAGAAPAATAAGGPPVPAAMAAAADAPEDAEGLDRRSGSARASAENFVAGFGRRTEVRSSLCCSKCSNFNP